MVLGLVPLHWSVSLVLGLMSAHWSAGLSQEFLTLKSGAKLKPYVSGIYNMVFEVISMRESLGYCQENTVGPYG